MNSCLIYHRLKLHIIMVSNAFMQLYNLYFNVTAVQCHIDTLYGIICTLLWYNFYRYSVLKARLLCFIWHKCHINVEYLQPCFPTTYKHQNYLFNNAQLPTGKYRYQYEIRQFDSLERDLNFDYKAMNNSRSTCIIL